jgi:hypothetical protein
LFESYLLELSLLDIPERRTVLNVACDVRNAYLQRQPPPFNPIDVGGATQPASSALPSLGVTAAAVAAATKTVTFDRKTGAAAASTAARLSGAMTVSSRLKVRLSEDMDEIWAEIEASASGTVVGEGQEEEYEQDEEEEVTNPTYAMACLKRADQKCQGIEEFVANCRQMFLLQVSRSVAKTVCTVR